MKRDRNRAQRRAMHVALIVGAAGLCFATAASADTQAAKKLGQMGVINQTLQPKPVARPTYSNTPNANTPNPNYNANSTYNPNTTNAVNGANAGTAATTGAAPKK